MSVSSFSQNPSFSDFLAKARLYSLAAAVGGTLLCGVGWALQPAEFFPAYLVAFLFWLGLSLGALAVVMLHQLSGGGWGQPIRRILEATFITLPLMAVMFLPLLPGMSTLYLWSRPDVLAHDEILQRKTAYLNVDGFQLRAAVYFVLWIGLAALFGFMIRGQQPPQASSARDRLGLVAGLGMILWVLTTTFYSVDWAMSVEPHWYSSMYGVIFMAGEGISGLGFGILLAVLLSRLGVRGSLTTDRLHDMGNLLLAFTLFWSYVSIMQYLIIWSGNLPEETPWYQHRISAGWQFVALLLVLLHFLLPFLLLLYRQTKRKPEWLVRVVALILVMRWVDLTWQILPAYWPNGFHVSWLHFVTPVAIGGWWLAAFAWRLPVRLALPEWEISPEEAADELAERAAH